MPPRNKTEVPAKPKNTFATMKRIFSYMHGFRLQLVFVVIGIIPAIVEFCPCIFETGILHI